HVVVRAKSQTSDLIDIVLLRGDHDDRRILLPTDLTADFKPVHSRKHQIEDDQIKVALHPFLQTGLPIVCNLHLEIAQLQIIFLKISDALFVFHDQNTFTHQSVPPDIFLLQNTSSCRRPPRWSPRCFPHALPRSSSRSTGRCRFLPWKNFWKRPCGRNGRTHTAAPSPRCPCRCLPAQPG